MNKKYAGDMNYRAIASVQIKNWDEYVLLYVFVVFVAVHRFGNVSVIDRHSKQKLRGSTGTRLT